MTDEPPQDQAPDPPDGVDPNALREDELDALLAEASSLASEISEEVGEVELRGTPGEVSRPANASGDPSNNLDAQLAELEQLAETAGSEIGADTDELNGRAPEPDSVSQPEPASPPESETGDEVPSFMEEFTRPEEPQAAETPVAGPPNMPASNAPGVVSSKTIGIISSTPRAPSLDDRPAGPVETFDEEDTEPEEPPAEADSVARVNPVRRAAACLPLAALAACERSATLLEAIDKPFGGIGENLRRILGWVAVATFATSLIVLLLSLL
jgi:hypothetical protein